MRYPSLLLSIALIKKTICIVKAVDKLEASSLLVGM